MVFVTSGRRGEEVVHATTNPPTRGLIESLPSPRPIGAELPAAFQEDDFCQRMMSAFDEVLAPMFTTLDCLDSYLDPELAPDDFVDWLASWVGIDIDETWTLERLRRLILDVVALYRIRGTGAGLAAHVNLYAGVTPEIEESGGCDWSETAGSPMPGSPHPHLTVRLRVEDADNVKRTTVSRIVAASRPAHMPYLVEMIIGGAPVEEAEEPASVPPADDHAPGAVDLPGSEHIELAPQAPPSEADLEAAEAEGPPEDSEPTA
jgi:phage tail-like protein